MKRIPAQWIVTSVVVATLWPATFAVAQTPPTEAVIDCSQSPVGNPQQTVTPHRDGVHIRFVNATTKAYSWTSLGAGGEVPPGGAVGVADLGVGAHEVACFDQDDPSQDPPSSSGYRARVVTLTVLEGAGWRPYRPECGPRGARAFVGWNNGPELLTPGDLPTATALTVRGLRATDTIERAGYPSGPNIHMRVVRNGRVFALADFQYDRTRRLVSHSAVQQCMDDLPARQLLTKTSSPLGVAYVALDADALNITRTPAMDRTLRATLNRGFSVRCAIGSRVRVGVGRFRAGMGQTVVILRTAAPGSPRTGRCDLIAGGERVLSFKHFAPVKVF